MASSPIRFGDFSLDRSEAVLRCGEVAVPLQPRCFDLLAFLAAHPGQLVTRDRLFAEVWPDVTVGDEALTQAVKELRKALGDDAASPRFIETVPRRGYRFIATPVPGQPPLPQAGAAGREATAEGMSKAEPEAERLAHSPAPATASASWTALALAGTLGGGLAGLAGGILYGLVAGLGNDSALAILLVMASITTLVGMLGALGLTLGMIGASRIAGRPFLFSAVGAAIGGFLVADLFHLLATGTFSFLLGRPHDDFAGGIEGLILGAGVALGASAGGAPQGWRRPILGAGLGGAIGGFLISLLGGKLMAASLGALARRFHGSQLDLGLFGRLSGEHGLSPLLQALVAAGEGLLLGSCLTAALLWRLGRRNARNQA